MSWLILFDADNTLWDADAVYRDAQLQLLSVLSSVGLLRHPERELASLRAIDMDLARHFGIFEYNIEYLARAIALRSLMGITGPALIEAATELQDAPAARLSPFWHSIEAAARAFYEGLLRVPDLFPDTVAVLRSIHKARLQGAPLVTAVLTEGRRARIERVFAAHNILLGEIFDEVIIVNSKSREAFKDARAAMERALPAAARSEPAVAMMVGDTLTRDIKFANQASYLTIYKPSPFKGVEQPAAADEIPDYTITRLTELLPILTHLGLELGTQVSPNALTIPAN